MADQDVVACYNMSLKEFEHSSVHDLFKAYITFFISSCQQYTRVFCLTKFSFV